MEENKFNFTEEELQQNKDQAIEQSKEAVKQDVKGLWKSFTIFINELLGFREDTDRDATIEAIKADIPFKGATAWILICSIMVASVGLNADSTAVVIGAMLISPLMGPILGLGMSIAINDIDTLKSSLINLAVMIVLSLLTAYLFFAFFPTAQIETNEIFGRTKPDLRDVLIAFFGGLALIIARTKKGTVASVIFGVAIATALMPPLCTAGYGLAHNWEFFKGAMNLFAINTTFIALATFIVLKVLRFPMLKYANSKKRKRIAQFASLVAIAVMIYPTISFLGFIQEKNIEADYDKYLKREITNNDKLWLQSKIKDDEKKTIKLYFNNLIDEVTIADFEKELLSYDRIKDYKLIVYSDDSKSAKKLSNRLDRAYNDLDKRDNIIAGLQKEVEALKQQIETINKANKTINFSGLAKDAKIRFSNLESFGYANMQTSNDFINTDTIAIATASWNSSLTDSLITINNAKLKAWLKQELKLDSVVIKQ